MNFRGAGMSVEKLVSERFKVRDRRQNNRIVPFIPNKAQSRFLDLCDKVEKQGRRHRYITVKCRRVGLSRIVEAVGVAYMFAHKHFDARIMAQRDDTAIDLSNSAALMASGLPVRPHIQYDGTKEYKRIVVPRKRGPSILTRATAKSPGTGRGRAFNFGHFSECAYYPEYAPFTAMLPTIATDPKSSFAVLESTGNGKIGIGQKFWEYWENAGDVDDRTDSEFIRFFVPYTENPWCVADPEQLAEPLGVDEEERTLLKIGIDPRNIAWRRISIATEYAGIVEDFQQENPLNAAEAFIAQGRPAFAHEEIQYANRYVIPPPYSGDLERSERDRARIEFRENATRPILHIWHMPKPGHEYAVGADAARGIDTDNPNRPPGDYSAAIVFDSTTGEQVAGSQTRLNPRELADFLDKLGRFYCTPQMGDSHFAWMYIELTGNLGLETQRRLREDYHYPRHRFAPWRGRDDRIHRLKTNAIGWETNDRTRQMMFAAFRASLRERAIRIYWGVLADQLGNATMEDSCWDVVRGHDDVLMAAMIAWMARIQNPPQTYAEPVSFSTMGAMPDYPVYVQPEMQLALVKDWEDLFGDDPGGKMKIRNLRPDPLEGILPKSSAIVEY